MQIVRLLPGHVGVSQSSSQPDVPDVPGRQSSDVDNADSNDSDRLVAFVDISSGQRRLGLFVCQHPVLVGLAAQFIAANTKLQQLLLIQQIAHLLVACWPKRNA